MRAADRQPSYTTGLHKTCLTKGHVELGAVHLICVISVCDGNVTLAVRWGCSTRHRSRHTGSGRGCSQAVLPGIRVVQQAHRSVTWPCSMQIIWMLSTKRDKVHLHHIATQWEGGARQPWSGNGFAPLRVALKDYTHPSPHFYTCVFTCTYLLCSSTNIFAESLFLSSFLLCVTCSTLSLFLFSHDKIALTVA